MGWCCTGWVLTVGLASRAQSWLWLGGAPEMMMGDRPPTKSAADETSPVAGAAEVAGDGALPVVFVTLGQAFWFWLKLGFISFGGPAGQIAILHEELVQRRRWISERRFLHALNFCMMLPGPEAQQLATYIGWLMHRTWGGVLAGALFILPSLVILIAVSWIYVALGEAPLVAGLFYGIKPAVSAIVLQAAHRIGSRTLRNTALWAIAGAALFAVLALDVPFPAIVLGAALVGVVGGRWWPMCFTVGGGHAPLVASPGRALIDDDTPIAPHAAFQRGRLARVALIGAALWLLPMGLMATTWGWQHTLTQMGWFFTKAALLTFGGAYAVLPYVYQGAVLQYGWVTPAAMIDGLALGETTPGPLIMVVAFVGFVGGYVKMVFGPDQLFLSGAVAACLVTWFTFLPSFVFILIGGPVVETSRNNLKFTAPLTAIAAAVVGVILNLALFLGYHVLWPRGWGGSFDATAAVIAMLAGVALFRYRWKVIHVIAGCAALGLAAHWQG